MKLVSLTVLHYGREWLEWALRSTSPFVDEQHIFYTSHPSHGHTTRHKCPDTRAELREIASGFTRTRWHDVDQFYYEGDHRDYARQVCLDAGADLILVLDSDEVWDPDDLDAAITQAAGTPGLWKSRIKGNFWRSVNWVCRDELMPDRIFVPGAGNKVRYLDGPGFWHFGYCIAETTMLYKLSCHGHRDELRPGWYPRIYRDWKPGVTVECGVHPTNTCDSRTGKSFWVPEPFDRNEIRHLIGDSPYFSDELV